MDLTIAWAVIIAFVVLIYVVLDGFDLGVGILFPLFPKEPDRDVMMNAIAPFWDGNETWLVMGGASLFAAFPIIYATVLTALYLPLVFMLLCLIFRGVSFELRSKARRTRFLWDLAFIGGSAGATFFQGVSLGSFITGIPFSEGHFAGDPFGWCTPFAIFVGLALMVTYALLGCCFLIAKTEGDIQRQLYSMVWPLTLLQLLTILGVSIWTPLQDVTVATRWFHTPLFYRLLPIPLAVILFAWLMRYALRSRHEIFPFVVALGFVVLGFLGLLVSISPDAILPGVSIWDAAAPRSSQVFLIVGVVLILPVIIVYTRLGYWILRGKVRHGDQHYH